MKIFNAIPCRGFNICYGYASPNEVVRHPNTALNNTQNHFYLVDGSVSVTNGTTTYDLPLKEWKDLSEFKTDKILTYTVGINGCSWVIILPTPNEDEYTVTEVTDSTVSAQSNAYLLVTEGENVTMNGHKMNQLNYAPLDKSITIVTNGGKVHKLVQN